VLIPLVGNEFTLPLVKSFTVEAAVRYDRYSDFGSTTNPKISADWEVGYGLTLRGSFGTSFRAPQFQEQATSGPGLINITATGAAAGTIQTCPVIGSVPVPGSSAAQLVGAVGNCPQYIPGLSSGFNPAIRPPDFRLTPETAQNLNLGFEFAPTDPYLNGLDIQMSYWYLRIRNVINNYYGTMNLQSNLLDNPIWEHTFLTPANDPNFAADVKTLLSGPKSSLPITLAPLIQFIADTGNHNIGWNAVNGVDFQANYSRDFGDWGLWNTGVTGTYLIDNKSQGGPGQIVNSLYHTPQAPAPSTATDIGGHLKYRVRLGWASDGWNVTGFMNFLPHFNSNTAALPPACLLIGNTPCNASGLPQFSQYTKQYPTLSSLVPGLYTFDMTIGYNTGDKPAKAYLQNIGIQLNVTNILNKQAPYAYQIAPPGGQQSRAYFAITQGSSLGIDGRVYALTVTKVW
jgi:iron complex outermembrane receptor protein